MLTKLTRRDAMKAMGTGALATTFANLIAGSAGAEAGEPPLQDSPIPYELGTLPYSYNGLEPQINGEILRSMLNNVFRVTRILQSVPELR